MEVVEERNIVCEECGKFLFHTNKTKGAAGAEASNRGFVYKNLFLYGIYDGGHFFCCKECFRSWLEARTTKEQREEGRKNFEDIKKRMEEYKPELLRGLQKIHDAFMKVNKGIDTKQTNDGTEQISKSNLHCIQKHKL